MDSEYKNYQCTRAFYYPEEENIPQVSKFAESLSNHIILSFLTQMK